MKYPMASKRVMNLGPKIFDRMAPSRSREPFKGCHQQWKWWAQSKERSIAKANRVNTKSQIHKVCKATTTSRIHRHIAWKATASTAMRAACLAASSAKPKANPTRADTTPPRRATKRYPPPQDQRLEPVEPLWSKITSRTSTRTPNNESKSRTRPEQQKTTAMRSWTRSINPARHCNLKTPKYPGYVSTRIPISEFPVPKAWPSKLTGMQLRMNWSSEFWNGWSTYAPWTHGVKI